MIAEGPTPRMTPPSRGFRYHFHLVKGTERIADVTGTGVSDIDRALAQTLAAILQVRGSYGNEESCWDEWHLEVTDACGIAIFRVDLGMVERSFEWVGGTHGRSPATFCA